jgi:hypothetical protein
VIYTLHALHAIHDTAHELVEERVKVRVRMCVWGLKFIPIHTCPFD